MQAFGAIGGTCFNQSANIMGLTNQNFTAITAVFIDKSKPILIH